MDWRYNAARRAGGMNALVTQMQDRSEWEVLDEEEEEDIPIEVSRILGV